MRFLAALLTTICISPTCYADKIIECNRVPYNEASKIDGKIVSLAIGCSYDGMCCDLKDFCFKKDGDTWCYITGVKPE